MNVVFILGAGASRKAGGPLMSDCLDVADKLHRSESLGPAFDDVRQASSDLQAIHAKSKLDVDNVETLFGAIEMGRIIGQYPGRESSDIDSLRDSLVTVIVKTLERSIPFPVKDSRILPPEPYLEFGNAIRALIHDQPKHLAPTFSFITFNYDLLLDFAFNYVGLDCDYWVSSDPNLDSIPMLKLHGSINWAICSVCNEIVPFMVNEAHFNLRPGMAKVYYDMGSKPELPISSCLGPSNAPSSTRAIVVSLTDAVNHPIKLTKPSLGVVS